MNTAVGLVEAYLRLNGYFTVTEFQVQHPVPGQPGRFETATDLDIMAVRFPWAAETVLRHAKRPEERRCEIPLAEDPRLGPARDCPDVLIAEVKEGAGGLNRRLQTPEVLYAALRRVGCCPEEHIADVAEALLRHGGVRLDPAHLDPARGVGCRVRLAAFCGYIGDAGPPAPLTIALDHVLRFIRKRLTEYRPVLRSAQFGDPVLNLLKLADKLDMAVRTAHDEGRCRG